ncbi:MAG: prolyl oligopeptidase family serine peptidase [Gammaproteobacteria bacterium]|nr:prolyl oligopeptidase family serine peptidase [Gammaproteobacteria bacterium]
MTSEPTVAPYGTWQSPISAASVAAGSVRLDEPRIDGDRVLWLESRPSDGGRTVVVERQREGTVRDLTPDGFNVRSRVHEYGGGAYLISGEALFFSNWSDQRIYRQDPGNRPVPITPEPPVPAAWRYADGRLTPDGRSIVCVRERHESGETINELVQVPTDGATDPRILVGGHDFFSSPRISRDGTRLAWLSWDHPNMPWDGTELWSAELLPDCTLGTRRKVCGGSAESIVQPEWGPDGSLYWLSDQTGFWNLYRDNEPLAPVDADCAGPAWMLGRTYFGFLDAGRIAMTITESGFDHVIILNSDGSHIRLDLPLGTHRGRLATDGKSTIVVISGSPSSLDAVREINTVTGEIKPLVSAGSLDPAYISAAQPIRFPTDDGPAHAFFYPPANADFEGPDTELPPLVVFSHGGPTGATRPDLDPTIQFFTSRGIAVVDVNYGGSTGYGRGYRQRLRGTWGIVDTRDCIAAARHLVSEGLVDGDRMAIRGASAGGFTTLSALTFHDVFQVGASYYGVGDLEALARDTHKFEAMYLDSLIGPYPRYAGAYRQRSPIHFTERLSCPVILFQGLEDQVVRPAQAEAMVAALKERGIPYAYVTFRGEQHGFRQAEHIAQALNDELSFYGQALGFTPRDIPLLLRQNVTTTPSRTRIGGWRGPRSWLRS